jgi:hypothetical protein
MLYVHTAKFGSVHGRVIGYFRMALVIVVEQFGQVSMFRAHRQHTFWCAHGRSSMVFSAPHSHGPEILLFMIALLSCREASSAFALECLADCPEWGSAKLNMTASRSDSYYT